MCAGTCNRRLFVCCSEWASPDGVQIIYLFYPETKGRALEDMDALFGSVSSVPSERVLDEDGPPQHSEGDGAKLV